MNDKKTQGYQPTKPMKSKEPPNCGSSVHGPKMTDNLIRHKWPEEKPEHGHEYLVYSKDEECGCYTYIVAEWKDCLTAHECEGPYGNIRQADESGWYYYGDEMYLVAVDGVQYWWELPEVKE